MFQYNFKIHGGCDAPYCTYIVTSDLEWVTIKKAPVASKWLPMQLRKSRLHRKLFKKSIIGIGR